MKRQKRAVRKMLKGEAATDKIVWKEKTKKLWVDY